MMVLDNTHRWIPAYAGMTARKFTVDSQCVTPAILPMHYVLSFLRMQESSSTKWMRTFSEDLSFLILID